MNTDFRGNFKQGSTPNLILKIADLDGTLIDPSIILVTITGPNENVSAGDIVLADQTPYQVTSGYYVYEWSIDADQIVGTYTVDWEYVVSGVGTHQYHTVVVVEDLDDQPSYYTERIQALRTALEHHIACAQNIPIYFEQSKPSRDRSAFDFSFKRWNQASGVRVYRNQDLIETNVDVDWNKGQVVFSDTLLDQDVINVDYNFRWFSEDEIDRFIANAILSINAFAPASGYTVYDIPTRFIPALLYGASKDALRQMMMCLQFQQPQQVFGGEEAAQKAFTNMESLKKNYEEDWKLLLEQKKLGPYPSLQMSVTPEYTLPGGRSLSPETTVFCIVNEDFRGYDFENVYTTTRNRKTNVCDVEVSIYTLKDIYKLFKQGYEIEILSHSNITGNLIFSPINYVWQSGFKTVYELKTTNGYSILSSDEHLFYVNGKYIPLMDIRIGDEVITSDNHNIETSRVKSIKQKKRKQEMLDLEVYETANLFANGIKCHNSRWFRYLFKG